MISVTATTGLLDTIAGAGANPDQILGMLGLERSDFANHDGFIASSAYTRILEEAARATGDECFGLHFGEHFDPRDIGALVYVILNSPTIAAAIENTGRYLRIHNEAVRLFFRIKGQKAYLSFLHSEIALDPTRQHNEYTMAVGLKTFRIIGGSQWMPHEVHFAHAAPPHTSEHLRVFGSRVLFGCATNSLIFERDFVDQRLPATDARLYRILKQHAERMLSEMVREDDLFAAVRKSIVESIGEGNPTLARSTKILPMSSRTLERRLKEHGTSFKQLADDTRRRLALDYLLDGTHTLTQIAFLLGYSEVSAFNRAFKRWTGSTPLEYRNKARIKMRTG
jgi:AraC-like DNA-binding protein